MSYQSSIILNCRTLGSNATGVQRYVAEIGGRLGSGVEAIKPKVVLQGMKGHLWEQLYLPWLIKDQLLFSPANVGPLAVANQVLTIHDLSVLDHPEWFSARYAGWYKWLLPRLIQKVRRVITVSDFSRERILRVADIAPESVVVIPNGVDPRFRLRSDGAASGLNELALPTSRYILTLSSIEPRKNLRSLLHAWRLAQGTLPDDVWLVVAGGAGASRIFEGENLAEHVPPRTHFTGHVPDALVPSLYASALMFCYVSVYEGFGLPPLEAMASGVPVLTSNTTSLPEVVGDAGMLVNPLDVEQIADGIRRLASDSALRASLREKGLARARLFSWDETARRTKEVLQAAMS